jgi:hypothetical protein
LEAYVVLGTQFLYDATHGGHIKCGVAQVVQQYCQK